MVKLRERPLRLESSLTQDYINRAAKMAEIEARLQRRPITSAMVAVAWVMAGSLLTIAAVVWWGQ